jgi:cysteine desulfuration protein SufE
MLPGALQDLVDAFALVTDPADRANLLIGFADQFETVPAEIATPPYPEENRVPYCESDAYVWLVPRPDGTADLHFAVANPSGISAKALASILRRTLSGIPVEAIADVPPDIVEQLFRQNISMGKGMGLMSMVAAVQALARRLG